MKQFVAASTWIAVPAVILLLWPLSWLAFALLILAPIFAGTYHRSWETGLMAGILAIFIFLPCFLLVVLPRVVRF